MLLSLNVEKFDALCDRRFLWFAILYMSHKVIQLNNLQREGEKNCLIKTELKCVRTQIVSVWSN